MKRLLSKRVVAAFCLLVLVLFLLRPGAGWMQSRVSNSISRGLGRNVQIGSVRFRFLPRPGFEIDNLVVRDDPAFGAEPLVRAPEVDAAISLGALVRGRFEISRLSLSEPSLNLTRNAQGKWNLEDLIDRTSHSSLAPTGMPRISTAPSFPYIEATDARMNFKLGTEKTHFAFTSAEFALWQESENAWGARLKARPIRTDANLTDTGVVTAEGLWRRSAQVDQTPVSISFQWKQAQIGQVSKLIYGTRKAWRGAALLSGSISGTPERLKLVAETSINDFRREDVIGSGNLRLDAQCSAEYAPAVREISNLDCTGPIGGGYLQVKGEVSGILISGQPFSTSDLWLVLNHVPAASLVNVLRHVRPEMPSDLDVSGDVSSTIQIQRSDLQKPVSVQGKGSVEGLQIARSGLDTVDFGAIPFSVSNSPERTSSKKRTAQDPRNARPPTENASGSLQEVRVELGPVDLAPGKSATLAAQAVLSRTGYSASAHGDTGVSRLLQVAKALGLSAPAIAGDGSASVNLRASGEWFSGERPMVTGTAHLRSVHAQVRGLNSPINVLSADLTVDQDSVTVQNLSAEAADATWHGSLSIPRPCPTPADCELRFTLRAERLSAAALNNLLNPSLRPKVWYRFLSLSKDQPAYLLRARATGRIAVDKLVLGKTACSRLTSDLRLNAGAVGLSNFQAECLQGKAEGTWETNFNASPPEYKGTGSFDRVSLADVAELTHDGWVEGSGSAKYEFKASGSSLQDLINSADLSAQFKVTGGRFAHIALTRDSGPLRASDFSGALHLASRMFSLRDAKLTSGGEVYMVSGTASLGGALNLKVVNENAGYAISGTFAKTRVSTIPNAEASLKP